jgi:hypothetical protein
MTGNHRDNSISRRRALAVSGGTVAAGGLVLAGYQSAFADTATDTEATASATSTGSACMTLPRGRDARAGRAVSALTGQLALAPKPGLPDPRDLAVPAGRRDHCSLRWSAKAPAPGLAVMAAAARRTGEPCPQLRAELGAIGRSTEHSVGLAGGGHRGALWALGFLVAAAALHPRAGAREVAVAAKRIAAFNDRGLRAGPRAVRRSPRSTAPPEPAARPAPDSRTYGGRWTRSPRPARPAPPRHRHGWTLC